MIHTTTDVVIHTRKPLTGDQFDEVSQQVKHIEGVIRFDRSQSKPQLILVVYDTAQTGALAILNKITRLGFNASLVGI